MMREDGEAKETRERGATIVFMGRFMGYAVSVGGNTGPTVPGLQFVQIVE